MLVVQQDVYACKGSKKRLQKTILVCTTHVTICVCVQSVMAFLHLYSHAWKMLLLLNMSQLIPKENLCRIEKYARLSFFLTSIATFLLVFSFFLPSFLPSFPSLHPILPSLYFCPHPANPALLPSSHPFQLSFPPSFLSSFPHLPLSFLPTFLRVLYVTFVYR